jgi:hypothetical protein
MTDLSKYGLQPITSKPGELRFNHWAYKADVDSWVEAHVVKRGGATEKPIVRFITQPDVDVMLVRFEQVVSKGQYPERPTHGMYIPRKKKK